jgi:hypothetical protein
MARAHAEDAWQSHACFSRVVLASTEEYLKAIHQFSSALAGDLGFRLNEIRKTLQKIVVLNAFHCLM